MRGTAPHTIRRRSYRSHIPVSRVTLWHGTTQRGLDIAQDHGAFQAMDIRGLAHSIADLYHLPVEQLLKSPACAFTVGRIDDLLVHTTGSLRLAYNHAEIGGEASWDLLHGAFRLLHPRTNTYKPSGAKKLEDFRRSHVARFAVPAVVELSVPITALVIPAQSKVQDPQEWFEMVSPVNTMSFPEIPWSWVSKRNIWEPHGLGKATP